MACGGAWHVGAWQPTVKPMTLKTPPRPAKRWCRDGVDGSRHALLKATDKGEQVEQGLRLRWKVLTSPKAFL